MAVLPKCGYGLHDLVVAAPRSSARLEGQGEGSGGGREQVTMVQKGIAARDESGAHCLPRRLVIHKLPLIGSRDGRESPFPASSNQGYANPGQLRGENRPPNLTRA